jgi:hypothetical protein
MQGYRLADLVFFRRRVLRGIDPMTVQSWRLITTELLAEGHSSNGR